MQISGPKTVNFNDKSDLRRTVTPASKQLKQSPKKLKGRVSPNRIEPKCYMVVAKNAPMFPRQTIRTHKKQERKPKPKPEPEPVSVKS